MSNFAKVRFILIVILSTANMPIMGVTRVSPKERLAQSVTFFDKGDYLRALDQLKNVEIRKDFDSSENMLMAFKIKAICYSELNETTKASETIRELFFLDPKYQFDLFDTPASTLTLAQMEREKIEEKSALLASAKNELPPIMPSELTLPSRENAFIEKKVYVEKRPHILLPLAPFGMNHFMLDSPTKGTIYATTQLLGLMANVGCFWVKQSYLTELGRNNLKNIDDIHKFDRAQVGQYLGLGGLILGYVISVIDALITLSKTNTQNLAIDETTS